MRLQGAGRGSFPLYGGTFARSYSVSSFFPLGGRLGYFSFFSSLRCREVVGVYFLLTVPLEGGFLQEGRGRGPRRVSVANWGNSIGGGGGGQFFFSGPKCPLSFGKKKGKLQKCKNSSQDVGQGGVEFKGLRGVAVTTEIVTTAEAAKTVKPSRSPLCPVFL